MRVRYRIDGKLYKSLEVPAHLLNAVSSRITVLLTPEEIDQAAKKTVSYTPPGR